jgi:hypothetical protein
VEAERVRTVRRDRPRSSSSASGRGWGDVAMGMAPVGEGWTARSLAGPSSPVVTGL